MIVLTWGLWFGGVAMLFLSVSSLFKTMERSAAGLAATAIFHRFEWFQLALAAVCIAVAATSAGATNSR